MNGIYAEQIGSLLNRVKSYDNDMIEAAIIKYISNKTNIKFEYDAELKKIEKLNTVEAEAIFDELKIPLDIEFIIEFFESLLDKNNKNENGIVFTPKYIADYINNSVIDKHNSKINIIDPGCGCGIFLVSAIEILSKTLNKDLKTIINNNIFGIDIDKDNVRRCKIVIYLFCLLKGISNKGVTPSIKCNDSLKCNWNNEFSVKKFDCIIGNPPYVNTHDMNKETAKFLKETFKTTKTGVYNIFYAFVENGMNYIDENGVLSYIVPNNFLTIKSALDLRKFITENRMLNSIIDFGDNMIFRPVRTYNCIIKLTKKPNKSVKYYVMKTTDNIEKKLQDVKFDVIDIERLDDNGWNFVDKATLDNLIKIESSGVQIKEFIRTGIATLRDDIYMVNKDKKGYFKIVNEKRYNIENSIVKKIYKVPDLKNNDNLDNVCRFIIFPYTISGDKSEIIDEKTMKSEYPLTYKYLLSQKDELNMRDKGKKNPAGWYAYGRTQGLNRYGKKLMFPTFAYNPNFVKVYDKNSLFCNGYAIFENDVIDLDILQKILNSKLMMYYACNTSYQIEGGYFCYQKKYIEKFSIPKLTDNEKKTILDSDGEKLDKFLEKIYNVKLSN